LEYVLQSDDIARDAAEWPYRFAAVIAVSFGALLLLMGNGHLTAVVALAEEQGRPLDARLVSHIATSGYLMFPALFSLIVARWLWLGRDWAYGTSIFNASVLMAYLVLLLFMVPSEPDTVGSELDVAAIAVGSYIAILAGVWAGMHWGGRKRTD